MLHYPIQSGDQRDVRGVRMPEADEIRMNPWVLWRPELPQQRPVLSVAELAECRCPGLCNRDHVNE
jgi:hypothetical protein